MSVALGGAAGALLRWALISGTGAFNRPLVMAWALLTVNTVGSFVLGAVLVLSASGARELLRLGLGVGFCGGLTTFSSFAVLAVELGQDEGLTTASAFTIVSVVVAVVAIMAGATLVQRTVKRKRPETFGGVL